MRGDLLLLFILIQFGRSLTLTVQSEQHHLSRARPPFVLASEKNAKSCTAVGWDERFSQLKLYKDTYGDTLVPKRYKDNPALGNWVNKQRQLYRTQKSEGKSNSLTPDRVKRLDQIGFVWRADGPNNTTSKQRIQEQQHRREQQLEEYWWKRFYQLVSTGATNVTDIPSQSSMGVWINKQRKEYKTWLDGSSSSSFSRQKLQALNSIDTSWWKTNRERQWELRIKELLAFKNKYGHCCVPISYSNKKLANFVSTQRKHYNLIMAGKKSSLTKARIQQLEAIGFVWNRWDDGFIEEHGKPW